MSAWLRGIVDESCGKENIPLCTEITETFFGIKCREMHTCGSCILTMLTAIAYRIDAEMAEKERLKKENDELKAKLADWKGNAEGFQPDAYMKLPLDADGEPIRVGDVLYSSENECRVVSITVKADEACVGVHTDEGAFLPSVNPKYLSRKNTKPLESEVLDADGVPIEVGDTVYCDDDPEQLIVDSFDDPRCVYITLAKSPNGILYTVEPSRLTHEFPDSWERIEEDAKLAPRDYLEKRGMNPEKTERIASMMADLVRRAKALAKAGESE